MKGYLQNNNRSVADVSLYSGGRVKLSPGVKTPLKEEVTDGSRAFYAQLRPLNIIYLWEETEVEKSKQIEASDETLYESGKETQGLREVEGSEDEELGEDFNEDELTEEVKEDTISQYTEEDLMRKRSSELKELAVLKGLTEEEAEKLSKKELTKYILN